MTPAVPAAGSSLSFGFLCTEPLRSLFRGESPSRMEEPWFAWDGFGGFLSHGTPAGVRGAGAQGSVGKKGSHEQDQAGQQKLH